MDTGKRKKSKRKLAWRLDVPEECFADIPVLELHGQGRLFVSGCRNIADYSEQLVVLMTGIGAVSVRGEHLTLVNFAGDKVAVEGRICRVELPEVEP